MKRVHIYYSGDVQGVGFRFTTVNIAQKFGVKGWVRNCADGRVELLAEAEDYTLDQFTKDLESAMSHYIREKKVQFEPATGTFHDFNTRY